MLYIWFTFFTLPIADIVYLPSHLATYWVTCPSIKCSNWQKLKKKRGTYKQQDRLDAFWRECEKGQEISQQQFLSTKPQGVTTNFSSLQFTSVPENNFPAAAVVSIHKCHLADQQASIGSQLAVNDRIASFQYWSGVEWIDCK